MKPANALMFRPAYVALYESGELKRRARLLYERLAECTLCPRECRVNRLAGRYGVCRSTAEVKVSSFFPHFGEEPPLVGIRGSGTIFFTSCNLWCLFCQNYTISHLRKGFHSTPREIADAMLDLQRVGCHNINLVTPTHFVPQIVEAVVCAVERGLKLPLVYNCGGYESRETLCLLDGIIDIYMPDIKYSVNANARRYSGAADYWEVVQTAVKEMHRQVGDLVLDQRGIAQRGLLIRHLVLPNDIAGSREVLKFIAREISEHSYVNIMDQYRPCFRATGLPMLNRPITADEFEAVIRIALELGLHRGFSER